jgi:uracil-DNA glycosylase
MSKQTSLLPQAQAGRLLDWPQRSQLAAGWQDVVGRFLESEEGRRLSAFLQERIAQGVVIYPPHPFRALELTALAQVHAVIVGQDPYHGPGQAEGLAFSVAQGVKLPPSLRNIFKEHYCDAPGKMPRSGSLVEWAKRGVLLLNTSLTVEDGAPASHARKGWEALTDALIAEVATHASPCVYLLWGAHAQSKAPLIERKAREHGREVLILQANHPSPLSASRPPVPFLGCGHFAQARDWLAERGLKEVFSRME